MNHMWWTNRCSTSCNAYQRFLLHGVDAAASSNSQEFYLSEYYRLKMCPVRWFRLEQVSDFFTPRGEVLASRNSSTPSISALPITSMDEGNKQYTVSRTCPAQLKQRCSWWVQGASSPCCRLLPSLSGEHHLLSKYIFHTAVSAPTALFLSTATGTRSPYDTCAGMYDSGSTISRNWCTVSLQIEFEICNDNCRCISGFQIVKQVGRGAGSNVYLARCSSSGVQCVLKAYNKAWLDNLNVFQVSYKIAFRDENWTENSLHDMRERFCDTHMPNLAQ